MNDLPNNELLSAYLDGELNAAEQAEMERLLAASPAARQLLDELRALSTTVQSLPHEKLDVDLSPDVLLAAAARRLTKPDRGEEKSAAVPLLRTVLRPFGNRRALAWLAVTAMVALMIAIHEHRQNIPLGKHSGKEALLARSEETAAKPIAPLTIQAPADALRDMKKEAGRDKGHTTSLVERANEPGKSAAGPAPTNRGMMVVRCNISPMAIEKRSLQKLLAANGIEQNERRDVYGASSEAIAEQLADQNKTMSSRREMSRQAVVRDDKTVLVEATPEQIEATLAGLKSQPDVFLSFSVEPASDLTETESKSKSQAALRSAAPPQPAFQFQQRTHVAGPQAGPGVVGRLDMDVRQNVANAAARQQVLFVLNVVEAARPPASPSEAQRGSAGAAPAEISPAKQSSQGK